MSPHIRRLRSLAILEVANIPLQAFIWFGMIELPTTWPNLTGFTLFAILLIQGAAYWSAKLDQLRTRRPHPRGLAAFAVARKLNPLLLTAGLLATGAAVLTDPGGGVWPGLGFALFAVLEHVNYFYVQLMHDTAADLRRLRTVGLRRSQLARDLARITR
ncbi:hypothetical protein GCM10012278_62110 [Nonomuraea glycinis]|uniref:Uncharacterized protein n=1 Tax=Nonomuraea glycinis TaxID=2047744 RepID=A0A918E950_9ACTN|nr:hypothetical protein GCM10012278_62110 [Nonomuraea glycinis]